MLKSEFFRQQKQRPSKPFSLKTRLKTTARWTGCSWYKTLGVAWQQGDGGSALGASHGHPRGPAAPLGVTGSPSRSAPHSQRSQATRSEEGGCPHPVWSPRLVSGSGEGWKLNGQLFRAPLFASLSFGPVWRGGSLCEEEPVREEASPGRGGVGEGKLTGATDWAALVAGPPPCSTFSQNTTRCWRLKETHFHSFY